MEVLQPGGSDMVILLVTSDVMDFIQGLGATAEAAFDYLPRGTRSTRRKRRAV